MIETYNWDYGNSQDDEERKINLDRLISTSDQSFGRMKPPSWLMNSYCLFVLILLTVLWLTKWIKPNGRDSNYTATRIVANSFPPYVQSIMVRGFQRCSLHKEFERRKKSIEFNRFNLFRFFQQGSISMRIAKAIYDYENAVLIGLKCSNLFIFNLFDAVVCECALKTRQCCIFDLSIELVCEGKMPPAKSVYMCSFWYLLLVTTPLIKNLQSNYPSCLFFVIYVCFVR